MIICTRPECQTTAGCTCTNRLFDYSRLRGEVAAKNAEISALKKQVEELTAERDDARRYAVEARLRENQAEDRRVSESFARAKAEAEAAALRKALEPFVALADKRDAHYRRRGGNCDKFPDAHPSYDIDAGKRELPMGVWRAARAALTSTKETGDAG